VLTGIVGLIAFLLIFSQTADITAVNLGSENPLNEPLEKWSSNAMTLALTLIGTLIISLILSKSLVLSGISTLIVLVGAWMFWV